MPERWYQAVADFFHISVGQFRVPQDSRPSSTISPETPQPAKDATPLVLRHPAHFGVSVETFENP
jgi:hypothetical protein